MKLYARVYEWIYRTKKQIILRRAHIPVLVWNEEAGVFEDKK